MRRYGRRPPRPCPARSTRAPAQVTAEGKSALAGKNLRSARVLGQAGLRLQALLPVPLPAVLALAACGHQSRAASSLAEKDVTWDIFFHRKYYDSLLLVLAHRGLREEEEAERGEVLDHRHRLLLLGHLVQEDCARQSISQKENTC